MPFFPSSSVCKENVHFFPIHFKSLLESNTQLHSCPEITMIRVTFFTAMFLASCGFVLAVDKCYNCASEPTGACAAATTPFDTTNLPTIDCPSGYCRKAVTIANSVTTTTRNCVAPEEVAGINTAICTEAPSTCFCKGHLCNKDPMPFERPSALNQLTISCYACNSANRADCMSDTFFVTEPSRQIILPTRRCAVGVPCAVIRKEDAAGKVLSVTRDCQNTGTAPATKPEVTGYATFSDNGGKTEFTSTYYCNTDLCNGLTTSARQGIQCRACNSAATTDAAEIAACKVIPTADTKPGISAVTCAAGIPCMTETVETGNLTFSVKRTCGDKPAETGCIYTTTDKTGLRKANCYTNTENGNIEAARFKRLVKCYKCSDDACKAAMTGTDKMENCPANEICLTQYTRESDGKETVTRGCSGGDRFYVPSRTESENGCIYKNAETEPDKGKAWSKCYCDTEGCNGKVTALLPPVAAKDCKNGAGAVAASTYVSLSLFTILVYIW